MKKWSDWSDFDINKAAAGILGVFWHLKSSVSCVAGGYILIITSSATLGLKAL